MVNIKTIDAHMATTKFRMTYINNKKNEDLYVIKANMVRIKSIYCRMHNGKESRSLYYTHEKNHVQYVTCI